MLNPQKMRLCIQVEYPTACCVDGNFPDKRCCLAELYFELLLYYKMELQHDHKF
jgi:hypothetical protein